VTELPIVKPQVVEHQVHRLKCPCCGLMNRGELPPGVGSSQFGLNVMSLAGLLKGRCRQSKRQVAQFLRECFGIEMAAGTIVNHQKILERDGDSYRIGWNLKLQADYLLVLWARVGMEPHLMPTS
jgi:hypothetical protein